MLCYSCRTRSANSLEHIIPAFLGGKKRVRILCHICNNLFGSTFEKDFYKSENARQLVILKIALNFYFWKGFPYEDASSVVEILRSGIFKEEIIFEMERGKEEFYIQRNCCFLNLPFGSFKVLLRQA